MRSGGFHFLVSNPSSVQVGAEENPLPSDGHSQAPCVKWVGKAVSVCFSPVPREAGVHLTETTVPSLLGFAKAVAVLSSFPRNPASEAGWS